MTQEPNIDRVDLLLQYILAVAGLEDWGNRELGPIHLIKYMYLADLAYAEHYGGETFTGLAWEFYHYGPWAKVSYHRIEPALFDIGAEKKIIQSSKFEDDFIRWTICDDKLCEELCEELEEKLSFVITTAIRRSIRKFGSDTAGLLDFVYKTRPMLQAAPGEALKFTLPDFRKPEHKEAPSAFSSEPLSHKEKKKRRETLKSIRQRLGERLELRKKEKKFHPTPPRYDEVFFEGVKCLDSMSGEDIEPMEVLGTFSNDVWKSKARFDPDISG